MIWCKELFSYTYMYTCNCRSLYDRVQGIVFLLIHVKILHVGLHACKVKLCAITCFISAMFHDLNEGKTSTCINASSHASFVQSDIFNHTTIHV